MASQQELQDVSRLADGTLDSARQAEVQARIEASPELKALYERERRVVDLLHQARAADRAPARLRAQIAVERPSPRALAWRRGGLATGLVGALAAAALVLALVLPGGTPGAPSLSQAAGLAKYGASQPAPAPDSRQPNVKLGRNVEDVYFPNWTRSFGWTAVGQRSDRIDGRPAVTVYYRWHGKEIAYTIVAAPALKQPAASITVRNRTELRTLTLDGRLVVTWRRAGHTCVLSGVGVPAWMMQRLAAWTAPGLVDRA